MSSQTKHPAAKMLDSFVTGKLLSGGWYARCPDDNYVGPFASEEVAREMVGWMDASYVGQSRVEYMSKTEATDLDESEGTKFNKPSVKADYRGWAEHSYDLLVWSINNFQSRLSTQKV